jgi:spermidine/putrescine transport system permease protein/putrescine transport system permease protein
LSTLITDTTNRAAMATRAVIATTMIVTLLATAFLMVRHAYRRRA